MPPIEASDSGNESSCVEDEEFEVDLESEDEISDDEEATDEESFKVNSVTLSFYGH